MLTNAERQRLAEQAARADHTGTRTQTRWRVITGAPGSGKTTLAQRLAQQGFQVVDDPARQLLEDELRRGVSIEQARADYLGFQQRVLQRQLAVVRNLAPDANVFFDYCIAESLAFMKLVDLPWPPAFVEAAAALAFRRVFLLAPLDLNGDDAQDQIRTETDSQRQALHGLIGEVYRSLGAAIVEVPAAPVNVRVGQVLAQA